MLINYKKLFRNKKIRAKILAILDFIPDRLMIAIQYYMVTGRKVKYRNPKRYTDKIQLYKLYYHDPLMTKCADKYGVREFIKERNCEELLVKLYGVYVSVDEINFDSLPSQFVIKTTNGSGTNIICKDKSQLDIEKTKATINDWMKQKKSPKANREWAYYNIENKIIVEEYIENDENGLIDYKFFCFDGKPSHLLVISDRFIEETMDIYDINWNRLNVMQNDCSKRHEYELPKPKNFEKMVEYARILSEGFPHARIDLYNIDGKIYFGEITFYSYSGYYNFTPDEFDFELGKKFNLPLRGQ